MIYAIDLYESLKIQFTDEQAKVMVKEIEKLDASTEIKIDRAFDAKKDVLATKNDISILELKIVEMEGRLLAAIANSRAENLKWSFLFWSSVMLPMIGMFITVLIKLK